MTNMPYIHELNGFWYFITEVIPIPYISFPKTSWVITAFILLSMLYGLEKYWHAVIRNIEGTLAYPAPNVGFFLDCTKMPLKLSFNPIKNFFFNDRYDARDVDFNMIWLIPVLMLICHYIWFIFLFKYFMLYLLVTLTLYIMFFGNLALRLNLILIVLLNLAYYLNFSIGFPVLEPHYALTFFGLISDDPWVINPNGFIVDINKYVYVFFLFFSYISLIRYVINGFYWKYTKNKPNKIFYQFFTDEELGIGQPIGVHHPTHPDYNPYRTDEEIQQHQMRESGGEYADTLKLLGFKESTIIMLNSEYTQSQIKNALDFIRNKDGVSNPKTEFLNKIEETPCEV